MKPLYFKKSVFVFCLIGVTSLQLNAQSSSVYFDLDACNATISSGDNMNYSEFTGLIENNSSCPDLDVVGGHLYRNNPAMNKHSCTPGFAEEAMCIGSNPGCTFTPGSDQALRIDLMVTPGVDGSSTLSELSFYEQGPTEFNWINGDSGPNNYPTLFGVRILKNGEEVFLSVDIPTQLTWNLRTFNFSAITEFTVTEPTIFNIELLPYCPVGNGALVSAWDLDEIRISANCCNTPNGGTLTGGPFEFCVGDGEPDHVSGIELTGQTGNNSQWVITDESNNILSLPSSPDSVNFDGGGSGISLVWHVSFEDGLSGLTIGNNLLTDLSGCFGLSNPITVVSNQPEGGELSGGPFEFCVGDSVPDYVSGIILSGNVGSNSQWVVTDDANNILSLPLSPDSVNFDGGGIGICFIWHVSYFDSISGLVVGNNLLSDLSGCFALSNSISVIRTQPEGGELTGGPFEFCVGDNIPDHVSGIILSGNIGPNSQWVVTNNDNIILSLPSSPDSVNFDGVGPGIWLIWHVSYFDSISGLVSGNNLLSDLAGCFALSNSITVVSNQPQGGELTGGPFEFCVGDSIADYVSGIILSGNVGPNSQWVITDADSIILSLPSSPDSVDFDGGDAGIRLIWHVSYFDTLSGLVAGSNLLSDLSGCFAISNSITVIRNQPQGGELTGGPFEFCVGDSVPDHVSGIILSGNVGPNSQWVITDADSIILSLPSSPDSVDFDGGTLGICLIWHVSYFDSISGLLVGNNLPSDIAGCFALSNSIPVIRSHAEGGELTGGPFEFCVGDSIPDYVSGIILSGNVGPNSQWVITDADSIILSLPSSPDSVDFDGGALGICLIWHISYFDSISGLEIGNNLQTDLSGCFGISNSITVIRSHAEGGELTGGPFEFCVGDSIPDYVSGIILSGNVGPNSQWVITDADSIILSLPSSPDSVDFDGGALGICLIWHVSYFDSISGLEIGNNLQTDLSGCFGISNSITVIRSHAEGGELTGGPFEFCVGDSIPDYVSGIILSGNVGPNSQWVITDADSIILSLPSSPDSVDFDGGALGICLIWHVSYFDSISGLEIGNNLQTDLSGCFGISNSITVIRSHAEGGELTGGPFEFCVGDSIPDYVSGIILSGNVGPNSQWVVTDEDSIILSLPSSPDSVDFDGGALGICLIWHVSYFDSLSGLEIGNNLHTDLSGCFGISNSITVIRSHAEGGELTGGPFEFCVGDSIPDYVSGIILSGNVGSGSQWVVTNEDNIILSLPSSPDSVNFDGGDNGLWLIWHVSYYDTLSGLEVGNNLLSDLSGCFALSNSITVIRNHPEGGELTGGPFEFCVGDSIPDFVSGIILSGNVGSGSQWVVTNEDNIILSLPSSPDSVNFDGGDNGPWLIWHVSYYDTLSGLEVGNSLLSDLSGCFALSNSITVIRNQPDGGELTGGPFEFCVGDSIPDFVTGVELFGNIGANSQYVVTDSINNILSLPASPEEVDFNVGEPGTCLIWHVSYDGDLSGLEPGNNLLSDLEGCFSISNSITVIKENCEGFQGGDPVFELRMHPNPVRDIMTLNLLYSGDEKPLVQLFDASGRLCFKQYYEKGEDMKINMNRFADGCYFIHIQSSLGNKTESILLVK